MGSKGSVTTGTLRMLGNAFLLQELVTMCVNVEDGNEFLNPSIGTYVFLYIIVYVIESTR